MTQSIMNKIKLAFIAASFALAAHAQNGINTPYSRYGFGIQSERAMGFNKGMGGVAQGFRNGQEVNIANPASYSAVDSLTALFDMGISLQNSNHKMGGLQQNIRNSSFDYFAFQFRAFKNVGIEGLEESLNGTTAIALSNEDQTAPARILGKFAEAAGDEKFTLKAGYVEGEVYDQAGVIALSKIPSKDVLLAQLVGSLQGPMQKLAATLKAVADKKSEEAA